MDDNAIKQAAESIRAGGIVAYPTEAVFGLGCDPMNEAAVVRLLALKERSVFEGLILIACSTEQLEPFIQPFTPAMETMVLPTWPGPNTWVVPAKPETPLWIRGRYPSVAVRVTAHPEAAALCRESGTALVSTSANLHGVAPARSPIDVRNAFGSRLDFVLDGLCGEQERPTAIRDAQTGAVLRQG